MIKEINDELTDLQMKCLSENIKWITPENIDGGYGSCFEGSKSSLYVIMVDKKVRWCMVGPNKQKTNFNTLFDAYREFLFENFE